MGEYDIPDFDFSVPGVTSISADMHKFGYAAKNASTVLYRSKDIRKYQIFACTSTTTYVLVNPTILSTKSAGPVAGAWAILNFLGEDGYVKIIREAMHTTRRLIDGINAIEELRVLGQPDMCLFSFASDQINVFQLADEMRTRGWYLQPQLSTELSPPNLHITINQNTTPLVDDFLKDLRESVDRVREHYPPLDIAQVKTEIEKAMKDLTPEAFQQILAMGGISGTTIPSEMALLNTVMDALPDPVCEELLVGFINDLYA
jgi:glutamate/tyrosine decarboxylase-like PLP-dependent enzyme